MERSANNLKVRIPTGWSSRSNKRGRQRAQTKKDSGWVAALPLLIPIDYLVFILEQSFVVTLGSTHLSKRTRDFLPSTCLLTIQTRVVVAASKQWSRIQKPKGIRYSLWRNERFLYYDSYIRVGNLRAYAGPLILACPMTDSSVEIVFQMVDVPIRSDSATQEDPKTHRRAFDRCWGEGPTFL